MYTNILNKDLLTDGVLNTIDNEFNKGNLVGLFLTDDNSRNHLAYIAIYVPSMSELLLKDSTLKYIYNPRYSIRFLSIDKFFRDIGSYTQLLSKDSMKNRCIIKSAIIDHLSRNIDSLSDEDFLVESYSIIVARIIKDGGYINNEGIFSK